MLGNITIVTPNHASQKLQRTLITLEPIYPVPQHAIMTNILPIKYAIKAIPGFRPNATLADAVWI